MITLAVTCGHGDLCKLKEDFQKYAALIVTETKKPPDKKKAESIEWIRWWGKGRCESDTFIESYPSSSSDNILIFYSEISSDMIFLFAVSV